MTLIHPPQPSSFQRIPNMSIKTPTCRPRFPHYLSLVLIIVFTVFVLHHGGVDLLPKQLQLQDDDATIPYLGSLSSQPIYDPAAALNIPSFLHNLQPPILQTSTQIPAGPPSSLLSFYNAIPTSCEKHPYLPNLHLAMDRYHANQTDSPPPLSDPDTLFIHVVSTAIPAASKISLSDTFITQAVFLSQTFKRGILLPQAAEGATLQSQLSDVKFLISQLRSSKFSVSVLPVPHPDEAARHMAFAKNLLVHRGSNSALGALLCRGTVYHTPDIKNYFDQNAFVWLVHRQAPAMPESERGEYRLMLDWMGPVSPSCCRFEAFGTGDGEKIACSNARAFEKVADETSPCWVLSLGCGGFWHFEKAIAQRTSCHIHTYDCTKKFEIPDELKGRVTLHELCLGMEGDTRGNFVSWSDVLDIGEHNSTVGVPRMPVIAKMDIEGVEFPIVREMINHREEELPEQLAVEVHMRGELTVDGEGRKAEALSEWFGNLTKVGYRLVHRADNPFCPHCSEVTLVRSNGLPSVQ